MQGVVPQERAGQGSLEFTELELPTSLASQQLPHKQVLDGPAGGDMSCTAQTKVAPFTGLLGWEPFSHQSLKITGGGQSGTPRSLKTLEPGAVWGSRSAVSPHYKTPWLRLEVAA